MLLYDVIREVINYLFCVDMLSDVGNAHFMIFVQYNIIVKMFLQSIHFFILSY